MLRVRGGGGGGGVECILSQAQLTLPIARLAVWISPVPTPVACMKLLKTSKPITIPTQNVYDTTPPGYCKPSGHSK